MNDGSTGGPPRSYSLAMIAQPTRENPTPQLAFPQETCAALLALHHIRSRNGSIIPRLGQLSTPPNVSFTIFDGLGSVMGGIQAFRAAATSSPPFQAIVGPPNDNVATVVAHLAATEGTSIPTIGHRAMATELANRDQDDGYPFFARVDPDRKLLAYTATTHTNSSCFGTPSDSLPSSTTCSQAIRKALSAMNVSSYGVLYDSRHSYSLPLVTELSYDEAPFGIF